ncbi:MAG: sigma-70 family RNA polymerase sigma factor [Halomonas sp.]|uniref:sigma-70 family RNA polymerase sigma factor n=1 Tax=Halomonadaceae TaxID=28256 RepID=UPI002649D68E|nr:sigma-70 family RNA polymerase sigma factor [Halomonas sp. KG2]WKD29259.1 sigma-70 family RNA polymerase sigma factor [Halomonas sp. KG2]
MPSGKYPLREQVHILYSDHHPWLLGWLRSRLGCSQQAADFAQDTFVRILGRSDAELQIEAIREPRSFLTTIANRVLIDHFRRHALEKAYLESLALQPESVAISLEEQAIMLEMLHELDAMLSGLGSKVRRAFLLSQLQGMRYVDIANELGVSLSSVKKYMAKATEACLLYELEAGL